MAGPSFAGGALRGNGETEWACHGALPRRAWHPVFSLFGEPHFLVEGFGAAGGDREVSPILLAEVLGDEVRSERRARRSGWIGGGGLLIRCGVRCG